MKTFKTYKKTKNLHFFKLGFFPALVSIRL